MAEFDISKTTTTDLTGKVSDFEVDAESPDSPGEQQKENYWDFPKATEYLGYYKTIPELKKAIDALAIWTVGKGLETDYRTQVLLENINGWGEDTFLSILWNLLTQKKALGDSFAEIINNEKGDLINLKPLFTGDMRVVVDSKGLIKRYEQRTRTGKGKPQKFNPYEIFHISNDRVANEMHGTSVIEAVKWVIEARNEAMRDHRTVIHRNRVPVRIIEVDTDNTTKRNALIAEYEEAINKGEVLVIPKGTVEIKDTGITIQDPIQWIQYLENFFYQAVGIPRVIATSQDFTEAGSKVGYLTFEPIYTWEQTQLEQDVWAQLGLRIKFKRPPSLGGIMKEEEQKNTGQTGFQPNEKRVDITRTE